MKKIFWVIVALIPQLGMAQTTDTFNDGDFSANPPWQGASGKFIVNASGQLQLNDIAAATAYLTTPFESNHLNNYEWRFYIKMAFAPSGSNFARVYLTSDSEELMGALNGYYLQLGEPGSNDAVHLFRQTGLTSTSVCRATDAQIANAFELWIKVTRDEEANWQLHTSNTGSEDYILGASGVDATHTSTLFAGLRYTYTISNSTKFFLDDFFAGDPLQDNVAPELDQLESSSQNSLILEFSEKLEASSAVNPSNYLLNNVHHPSELILLEDEQTVEITFDQSLENASTNSLTVSGVKDLASNEMNEVEREFFYFKQEQIDHKDIIFSELMVDPSPPQNLPEAEYIEIFNRSNKVVNLKNIKLTDASATRVLPEYFLFPDTYVVLTSVSSFPLFNNIENIISVNSFPTLTNSGEPLLLKDLSDEIIDSLYYNSDWYKDEDKRVGGFSLERINQENFCIEDSENWQASLAEGGGSPGIQNTVLNNILDIEPPVVSMITVKSENTLLLTFSERLYEELPSTSQFLFQPSLVIESISFMGFDREQVEISLQPNLQPSLVYHLQTNGLKDCIGNISEEIDAGSFILAEQAEPQDIIITEILPDPNPIVGMPEVEFVELYNRSNKVIDLAKYSLTDGNTIGTVGTYTLLPEHYVVLLPESALEQYIQNTPNVVPVKNFPTLNNGGETISLLDSSKHKIDSISYDLTWYHDDDKQSGGWSIERQDLNNFCFDQENWKASTSIIGGSPGLQNTVYTTRLDSIAPELVSVFVENENAILLQFNEKVNESNLNQITFSIQPSLDLQHTEFSSANYKEVRLQFTQPMTTGQPYRLRLNGVSDCSGNVMATDFISEPFGLSSKAVWKEIIINEIMVDPSPARSLPEAEYIEIYNRSSKLINLQNWTLKDNGNPISLGSKTILPDSFLILCSAQQEQHFKQYGETLSVSSFPTLSNSGETLTMRNAEGVLIDSINYYNTWYNDVDRQDGGWSLELIDQQNICAEEINWSASEDDAGGTPGKKNSISGVRHDLMGPRLTNSILINNQTLELHFDEKLSEVMPSPETVEIEPSLDISSISFRDNTLRSLIVFFPTPVSENELYHLKLTQLYDCSGNAIDAAYAETSFVLPQQASQQDVIINEILFNPIVGGVDFVELYNTSGKYLNLKNWTLSNVDNNELVNQKKLATTNLILHPFSYLLFTSNEDQLLNHYPQGKQEVFVTADLPPLADDRGSISVADSSGNILDVFFYEEAMHNKMLKSVEGVSLERISKEKRENDATIWKSGVLATGFATPGYQNANLWESSSASSEIVIDPEIFEPVSGQPNFTSISYKFDQTGYAANAKIFDAQGRVVRNLFNNQILSSDGSFTWDGDQDDGTKASLGYYTLWLEVFDNTGFVKTFRKRVVIATRF